MQFRVVMSFVFLLSLGVPLACVQVWYRRPAAPPSGEPVRIQFTTDPNACEADGWQALAPANNDDLVDQELRNQLSDNAVSAFSAEVAPTSDGLDLAALIDPAAVDVNSGLTASVEAHAPSQSSSSEFVGDLAMVPYEEDASEVVAFRAARIGRKYRVTVNEYPRK